MYSKEKIQRHDIHILARHSTLTKEDIDKALKDQVYPDSTAWQKYIRLFLISLGLGFIISGISFFFAYNWDSIHKFVKISLIQGLLILSVFVFLILNKNELVKKIILTAASVLVGVLFAVFGQVYQTGADAYDFFLGWTVFISLWVIVSNFAPLWLLYLVLIQTTFILYAQQVAQHWSFVLVSLLLTLLNVLVLCFLGIRHYAPKWFLQIVVLSALTTASIGICFGIFDEKNVEFFILISITTLAYIAGIGYGHRTKQFIYLAGIPLSLIVIICSLIIKLTDDQWAYLILTLFVMASVTVTIKKLLDFQKKWANEK